MAADVPVGFADILGMSIRGIDPKVVVSALVVLSKAGQSITRPELAVTYLSMPEADRDVAAILRTARLRLAERATA